ncbi:MAG: hypothetical protein K2L00_00080 [Muribaculaceae bacterium]|nr:hypothetical protein [Muribaculaceae bacterium]
MAGKPYPRQDIDRRSACIRRRTGGWTYEILHHSDEDFPSAAYYGALARGNWAVENGLIGKT